MRDLSGGELTSLSGFHRSTVSLNAGGGDQTRPRSDAMGRSRWLRAAPDHQLLDIRQLRVDFWRAAEGPLAELILAQVAGRAEILRQPG